MYLYMYILHWLLLGPFFMSPPRILWPTLPVIVDLFKRLVSCQTTLFLGVYGGFKCFLELSTGGSFATFSDLVSRSRLYPCRTWWLASSNENTPTAAWISSSWRKAEERHNCKCLASGSSLVFTEWLVGSSWFLGGWLVLPFDTKHRKIQPPSGAFPASSLSPCEPRKTGEYQLTEARCRWHFPSIKYIQYMGRITNPARSWNWGKI